MIDHSPSVSVLFRDLRGLLAERGPRSLRQVRDCPLALRRSCSLLDIASCRVSLSRADHHDSFSYRAIVWTQFQCLNIAHPPKKAGS
jgi:hypothetical protein